MGCFTTPKQECVSKFYDVDNSKTYLDTYLLLVLASAFALGGLSRHYQLS